jgi:UDP-3-O-[3-hydroxymyristoyl] glucosamine N-acyltransferase
MQVKEIAALLQAPFEGSGELEITGAAALEDAGPKDIAFASDRAVELLAGSNAGCVIVPANCALEYSRTVIRVAQPRNAFASVLRALYPPILPTAAVHRTAVLASTAHIDSTVEVGAHVSIGEATSVGAGTRISAGCRIGARVVIGRDCRLNTNVSIYDDVIIGDRVVLHSGCVLGADGFGFVFEGDHYEKFPQVGRVLIHDDVEVGANSCIDRAALGVTEIGRGTKLDNMVHIGHNCKLGKHVVIAAQTGLSGGVVVGDYAVIGGQVGIGDKARIEPHAVLGSGCGVLTSKIVRAGEPVWGTPARPLRQHLEQLANLSRVGSLREEVKAIKRRIDGKT